MIEEISRIDELDVTLFDYIDKMGGTSTNDRKSLLALHAAFRELSLSEEFAFGFNYLEIGSWRKYASYGC